MVRRFRSQIVVNAMGKRIVLDNPNLVTITFRGKVPMVFNLRINEDYLRGLRGALNALKRRR